MRARPLIVLILAAACHRPLTTPLDPAQLSVAPSPLLLADAYVGQTLSGSVAITSSSLASVSLDVAVTAPFTVDSSSLEVPGGSSATATVHFTAVQPGATTGTLTLGPLRVAVQVNALAVPACPGAPCASSHFDATQGTCVDDPLADGTACHTACVTGACTAGACKGTTTTSCDDGDACTVDACNDATGCFHQPLVCPGDPSHCESATCDPSSGCATHEAVDGTLCGPDDCLATQVDVCIAGSCVQRVRPPSGRCTNTWVPAYLAARLDTAIAFDAARQRVVLFGGYDPLSRTALDDTWEYDGTSWSARTPAASPPPRHAHAMAYDPLRQRTILFGGHGTGFSDVFDDTWEYDGTTWVQRTTLTTPPARAFHTVAYDTARARLVLYGGAPATGIFDDTWEFDGTDWLLRTPATTPGGNTQSAMAYDSVRQRTVLFGGDHPGIWEWDGTTWSHPVSTGGPANRLNCGVAWDSARQALVLVDALGVGDAAFYAWTWDGTSWAQLAVANAPPGIDGVTLTYDSQRQRLVAVGSDNDGRMGTYELDAQSWHDNTAHNPPGLSDVSLAYDETRQRVVLFGGYSDFTAGSADTWEWDGTTWSAQPSQGAITGRVAGTFAWDSALQRGVLFGGEIGVTDLDDTWLWDGASWTSVSGAAPSAGLRFATYDAARGVVLVFGGTTNESVYNNETWAFDGSWRELAPANAPAPRGSALTFDSARGEVVLFGGGQTAAASFDDTWTWDGTTWTQRSPMTSPSPRRWHALAYDSDRQVTLLYGGLDLNGDALEDTWEWNGTNWTQAMPGRSPPPQTEHAMAYDAARHRMLLFGSGGTWLYLP